MCGQPLRTHTTITAPLQFQKSSSHTRLGLQEVPLGGVVLRGPPMRKAKDTGQEGPEARSVFTVVFFLQLLPSLVWVLLCIILAFTSSKSSDPLHRHACPALQPGLHSTLQGYVSSV